MRSRPLKALLIASLAISALAGCGQNPTATARPRLGASAMNIKSAHVLPPAPANPADQDIGKNPFVIWIKQTYPKTAATIIDQYLSSEGPPNPDPNAEVQRAQLRGQCIDQVDTELRKNLAMGLPKGLIANVVGTGRVRVTGFQYQFGFRIELKFDFLVRMDQKGFVWITAPKNEVKAYADTSIINTIGGDLDQKAYDEIVKNLDEQGPPNAKKTPGLTYQKGGTFRVDPGFAFVNMPS